VSDVLAFEDDATFKSYLADLEGKQTSSARISTNSFQSFEYHFQNVMLQLDSAKTESEYSEILSKNSDILYVEDSVIQPKIKSAVYQQLCNRDRMYVTGQQVIKVLNDEMLLSTSRENVALIQDLEIKDVSSVENNSHIEIFRYGNNSSSISNINSRTMADECGSFLNANYSYNPSGCKDDRKVFVEASAYTIYANFTKTVNGTPIPWMTYQPTVQIKVWGEYRNRLCNWNYYSTTLSFKDGRIVVDAWDRISEDPYRTYSVSSGWIYYVSGDSNGDARQLIWTKYIGAELVNEGHLLVNDPFMFTEVTVKATSRGVNGNYAVINCPG